MATRAELDADLERRIKALVVMRDIAIAFAHLQYERRAKTVRDVHAREVNKKDTVFAGFILNFDDAA